MPTFFAVASLADFKELRREIGYPRALRELDAVRDAMAPLLPGDPPRANRDTIEFSFADPTEDEATERLHAILRTIDGIVPARCGPIPRRLVVAAVRCPRQLLTERIVARAEDLLKQAAAGTGVLVGELDGGEEAEYLLMADLRRAVRSNGLHLAYQPKVQARGGRVVGAEALVRWNHPVHGPISPTTFIPAAERDGAIRGLTDWVIDRVVADCDVIAEVGLHFPLHVNISAPLIADAGFVDHVLRRLDGHIDRIGFEITETAMMVDPHGTLANLRRLADAGMALSIDDYGTAFSSLSYLQQLPVSEIKIDRLFVARLTSGSRDPLLVRSTIDLAHALEMKVTAEGVETPAALALLQVMQCDMVQGFLLSRPLPLADMIALAKRATGGQILPAGVGHERWAKLARAVAR